MNVTLCVPFYRNGGMLLRQLEEWRAYRQPVRVIVVDDGSPEPAESYIPADYPGRGTWLQLYRIDVDIPWNREGARNLAAKQCGTDWLVHLDIDHILPRASCGLLLQFSPNHGNWYRFPRYRVGKADETRLKDALPAHADFGQIKPHIDSYLMRTAMYWNVGGYDEDFSGSLGGGTDFLRRAEAHADMALLPAAIALHVYTRDKIPDASDWSLSRDRTTGKEIARLKARHGRHRYPERSLRFPWHRVF